MSFDKPKILVVDDRDRYIRLAHELLRGYEYATRCELEGPCWECDRVVGCELTHAHDWSETVSALAMHTDIDVILLDLEFDLPAERLLPSLDRDPKKSRSLQGVEILRKVREIRGNLPVVLMTSIDDLRFEKEARELEVDEFVTMAGRDAFDARSMGLLIERIMSRRCALDSSSNFVWGKSKAMARLSRDAMSLGRTSLPVLLVGEPGTGKSALAERVLHPATGRTGPFVTVDLAAIPESLTAAELFGSVPGAFSGAVARAGCFERAEGGTLFLDEIGNLTKEVQRMLLVTLQSGRITRLGDGKQRSVDVKLVTATNTDLEAAVREGTFRGDLYARLNPSARLLIPPLRERIEDLEELARSFVLKSFGPDGKDRALLSSYAKAARIAEPAEVGFSVSGRSHEPENKVTFVLQKNSFEELCSHRWRGNVRELELLIASAAVFALSDAIGGAEHSRAATDTAPGTIPIPAKLIRELLDSSWVDDIQSALLKGSSATFEIKPGENLHGTVLCLERQLYKTLFFETNGDFRKMAARLVKGDPAENERRVRLRFNQLGLRVRQMKK